MIRDVPETGGTFIELHVRVHNFAGCQIFLMVLHQFCEIGVQLVRVEVPILVLIDMGIRDHMDVPAGLKPQMTRESLRQERVLGNVERQPDDGICAPLDHRDVELAVHYGIMAGIAAGRAVVVIQSLTIPHVDDTVTCTGVNAQHARFIIFCADHGRYLVRPVPKRVVYRAVDLPAIGLTDGSVLVGPLIPDLRDQVLDVVALLLHDPKDLTDGGPDCNMLGIKQRVFFSQVDVERVSPDTFRARHMGIVCLTSGNTYRAFPQYPVQQVKLLVLKSFTHVS